MRANEGFFTTRFYLVPIFSIKASWQVFGSVRARRLRTGVLHPARPGR